MKTTFILFMIIICFLTGVYLYIDRDSLRTVTVIYADQPPLRFGILPFLEDHEIRNALDPLCDYIGHKTGRTVRLYLAENYTDLEAMAQQKRLDILWYSAREKNSQLSSYEPFCNAISAGKGSYRGAVICNAKLGIKDLQGLKGRSFSYIDRNSSSGFIYPNRLFRKHGIFPPDFFSHISFSGSHDRCLQEIRTGNIDAGAVTELVVDSEEKREGIVVLDWTEPIFPDPFLIKKELPAELKENIEKAFLDISENDTCKRIRDHLFQTVRIKGFMKAGQQR